VAPLPPPGGARQRLSDAPSCTHTHKVTRRHTSSGTNTNSHWHMHAQSTFSVYMERVGTEGLVRMCARVLGGAHSRAVRPMHKYSHEPSYAQTHHHRDACTHGVTRSRTHAYNAHTISAFCVHMCVPRGRWVLVRMCTEVSADAGAGNRRLAAPLHVDARDCCGASAPASARDIIYQDVSHHGILVYR
jgi:hypothetical protein